MSFSVGYLWIGMINGLFNCTRSKHNLTFLLALGIKIKLLHQSDISSTHKGANIYCCHSHFSSTFSSFCNVLATLLGGAWHQWLASFTCKEIVPSKQPIPEKISLKMIVYSVWDCFHHSFVIFFSSLESKLIRHVNFVFARLKIIHILFCLYSQYLLLALSVGHCLYSNFGLCCMTSLHFKLSVVCFVVYCLTQFW